jgi:CBS domain-containing protein
MEIGSLITRAVLTVEEDDSFHDAAIWMIERGIGSAVVLKDGKPTGIITDRDALRVIARGSDTSTMTVRDCVTRGLNSVTWWSPTTTVSSTASSPCATWWSACWRSGRRWRPSSPSPALPGPVRGRGRGQR